MGNRKRAAAKDPERAIRMLTALHEVAMELAATRESEVLLPLIVQRATELVGVDGGGLYLYHPEKRELELVVSHNLGRDMRGVRLKLGEGLAGRVVAEKRSLLINDYQHWEGRAQAYMDFPISSSIAVPICWRGEVIGALNVHALRVQRRFSREDKRLLGLLASHAAVAIGKARLDAQQQESEKRYHDLVDNALVGIYTIQDGRFVYVNRRMAEILGTSPDRLIGHEVLPLTLPSERARVAEYIRQRVTGERDSVHYRMKVRCKDRPVIELELLGWRAELAGRPAIQGMARDVTAERETGHLRRLLLEIGQQMLQCENIDTILRTVAEAIREHSPFQLVALSLYAQPFEPQSGEADPPITQLIIAGLGPAEEEALRETARSGQIVPTSEILTKATRLGHGYFVTPQKLPEIVSRGVKGSRRRRRPGAWGPYDNLYYLLEYGGWVVGRLSLADPVHGRLPGEQDLEPLEILVNLATAAILGVRRQQENQRYQGRLKGLYGVSWQLARAENLESLCRQTLQALLGEFKYQYGAILLKEQGTLVLQAVESSLADIRYREGARFAIDDGGKGITRWVASTGKPALINDVRSDPRYLEGHAAINSELAVPIRLRDELLGVLNLESQALDAFGVEDLELLNALADQLAIAISNIRRRQGLQQALREREQINRFLQGLNRAKDLGEMLELVIEQGIERLSPRADAGSFLVWDEAKGVFEFCSAVNRDLQKLQGAPLKREQMLQVILEAHRPVIYTRTLQLAHPVLKVMARRLSLPPPASTISVPIRQEEQLIAVFNINNLNQEGIFTEEDAQKLWALVPEIELALARAQDVERLRKLSIHDPLTGLYNRRHLNEVLEREVARAKRYGHPLSLLIVDLDDFCRVNDTLGHPAGDRTLVEIAALIRGEVREADLVFRFGGDEFLILMPETDGQSERIRQRLQQAIRRWNEESRLGFPLSFSLGLSTWNPADGRRFDEVLSEADRRMYEQKGIHYVKGHKR